MLNGSWCSILIFCFQIIYTIMIALLAWRQISSECINHGCLIVYSPPSHCLFAHHLILPSLSRISFCQPRFLLFPNFLLVDGVDRCWAGNFIPPIIFLPVVEWLFNVNILSKIQNLLLPPCTAELTWATPLGTNLTVHQYCLWTELSANQSEIAN